MPTYTARVAREGKWWIVRVLDVDSAITQVRRLADAEAAARDLIAAVLDPAGAFDVAVEVEAVEDIRVSEVIDALASSRREAEAAAESYQRRLRSEAKRLNENGLTVRDIGFILGVSFQRAQQLLDESDRSRRRAS
ncbi:MAG: HicB family toxin-antitoxin system [Jatrophihabitans sp.]|uniref:HicB family toxin-antitoxin system n=1 Tax=Jatrophihabitans sp. TaxID=1932789 RepID=UPI003F81F810